MHFAYAAAMDDHAADVIGNAQLPARAQRPWWRDAVVYQVYPRSFADANGDGMGDLAGIRSKVEYLKELDVDAVWLSPIYRSPMKDGGYDVADPRDIDPIFGTLDDFSALLADLHSRDMRLITDIVPNHVSSEHEWFRQALAAVPGSSEWARFHIRRGRDGGPPNNWRSVFGDIAWTPMPGHDDWWYLNIFDSTQPDVNWDNPEIHEDFISTLRFWYDRGVDAFRIDVATALTKPADYPDAFYADNLDGVDGELKSVVPYFDRDDVHDIWRSWRAVSDEYDGDRAFVGEAWVDDAVRQAAYTRPDELHTTFNFVALHTPWDSKRLRDVIHDSVTSAAAVGAPATWVLSNHDVVRPVSRLAPKDSDGVADIGEGRRRAIALSLTFLALPGYCYIYQGEELGLDEVRELDDDVRQDPAFWRSKGADGFRDGCRVPLPWSGDEPPFGFSASHSWLPQPARWAGVNASVQLTDEGSILAMYRRALTVRRDRECMGDGVLRWLATPTDVVAFERPGADAVRTYINLSPAEVEIAESGTVLVSTDAAVRVTGGVLSLPASAACWLSH